MPGESYTSPVTGETFTVPTYEDPADAPIAFKDFADTITGGGIDIPATRVDAVVQTLDGSTWAEGMALSIVAEVPDDSSGQVGDVVFVAGKSPAPSGAAKISAITGSGRLTTDGDSTVIEWLDSGSVTISDEGLVPEALLVGGGGGAQSLAGGGGGQNSYQTSVYLNAGSLPVVVGDGGSSAGGNGGNSFIGPALGYLWSIGGGFGRRSAATGESVTGDKGASGGGAGVFGNGTGIGGLSIIGQGNGGNGSFGGGYGAGGGGGGASANGTNATNGSTAGSGGDGEANSITGTSVIRCGGGGGSHGAPTGTNGTGGTGGGGNAGVAGTANSGGGAGAASSGGSGIIILRLLTSNTAGMDTSNFTIVTAAMLAEQEAQRQAEQEVRQAEAVAAAEEAESAKAEKKAALKSKAEGSA